MDFFERIGVQLASGLPFVAYQKPDESNVKAILQEDCSLHELTDYTESGFVFAPFLEEGRAVLLKADIAISTEDLPNAGNRRISESVPEEENPQDKRTKHSVSIVARENKWNSPRNAEKESEQLNEGSNPPESELNTSEKEHIFSHKKHDPSEKNPKAETTSEFGAKSHHIALVEKAIKSIEKGDFRKVVLSRKALVALEHSPVTLFKNLLSRYDTALCYLWFHPKVGLWLGATPEILLKTRNRRLTTMSLAGTQTFEGDIHPTWGQKEREEQKLVTDYIEDALEDQVLHLERSETETVRAGELLHLRTKLTGILKDNSLESIIKALHPTPAVCGLPKTITKDFIIENEGYNREYYTGFLGELNLYDKKQRNANRANQENQAYRSVVKTSTLFVNLRCMQIKNEQAHIYVGGGITKDSNPEREWEETVAKSKTMLDILG